MKPGESYTVTYTAGPNGGVTVKAEYDIETDPKKPITLFEQTYRSLWLANSAAYNSIARNYKKEKERENAVTLTDD